MKRVLKWIGIVIGAVLGLVLIALAGMYLHWRTLTAHPMRGPDGRVIPGSIASIESIPLGGVRQTIYIRGADRTKPVILFLHGGPGSPEAMAVMHYNAPLEQSYVVVNWDQRGAGKSYSPFMPRDTMTVDRFVADTIELTEYLRTRFKKERIYLVGHSWGTVLGVLSIRRRPDLFHAYIGIGQVIQLAENERQSYAFVVETARRRGDAAALADLAAIDGYWEPARSSLSKIMTQRGYLLKYGGVLHGRTDYSMLYSMDARGEFSLFDLLPYGLGSLTSLTALWPQLLAAPSLEAGETSFDIPVYFFTGAHDYNVPFGLTERYFRAIRAPRKALVWFHRSGHMPNFEEPERFMAELKAVFR